MLTIERKVSQVGKLTRELDLEIDFHYDDTTDFQYISFREQLIIINKILPKIANEIEANWEKYTDEKRLDKTRNLLSQFRAVDDGLGLIDSSDETLKKELMIFRISLKHMISVLSDALEFVNVASEVREIRSKPLTLDEITRVKEILARSEEKVSQKINLPEEELKDSIKSTFNAMKKHR
ncbi:MAG: hypothetical protein DSM106950_00805 [Stigonema ocellatum SAG 48.90 = DSM 106950]|nr:hypothetical protein [Stigonema ocellatum SAG 48.90 = DSM 106950]